MLVPQRRGELEAFEPQIRDIGTAPDTERRFHLWSESRQSFNAELKRPSSKASEEKWQRHYLQGISPDGFRAPQHQMKLRLRHFK